MVNIRVVINEEIYDMLLEGTYTYFKPKTTIDEVIECSLVEFFSELQMSESNPWLSVKRSADSMLHRKNLFILAQEAMRNE